MNRQKIQKNDNKAVRETTASRGHRKPVEKAADEPSLAAPEQFLELFLFLSRGSGQRILVTDVEMASGDASKSRGRPARGP